MALGDVVGIGNLSQNWLLQLSLHCHRNMILQNYPNYNIERIEIMHCVIDVMMVCVR